MMLSYNEVLSFQQSRLFGGEFLSYFHWHTHEDTIILHAKLRPDVGELVAGEGIEPSTFWL
jgi:hypothetical protein